MIGIHLKKIIKINKIKGSKLNKSVLTISLVRLAINLRSSLNEFMQKGFYQEKNLKPVYSPYLAFTSILLG